MGTETHYGKKRPNGRRIMELRKEKGLKQETLAKDAKVSERLLRDIERKNHPVPTTTITAIAAELKVTSADITLSSPDASPSSNATPLLKLRAVRSATDLSALAERADEYRWRLWTDPNAVTALYMQTVMMTVHRLTQKFGQLPMNSVCWDEFDGQLFGEIPRLAQLQDLLTKLGTNGVNVIAGTHTYSSVRDLKEGENPDFGEYTIRAPDKSTKQAFKYVTRLEIRFVPCDVEEEVISIDTGRPLGEYGLADDDEF
jgi:transcriptional regulator with XRE-family HTH domain